MTTWANRKVLVTGAGGFIGSHLVEALAAEGADVRAALRYNSRHDRGALGWIDPAVLDATDIRFGDVRSREFLDQCAADRDTVFHLAASISIPQSYEDPRSVVESNIIGTINALEACRATGAKMVHTSTSEVYGSAQTVPITEDHPLNPQSPYAASKSGADQLAISYARSFEQDVRVLRPFNTFGPRQSARAVIMAIITQALGADRVKLGALDPRRDFTYVGDTAAGFMAIADAPDAAGQTLQLGTGQDISIGELAEKVGKLIGKDLEIVEDSDRIRPPASEVDRLISSPARMTELTGWTPKVSLDEGLQACIDWVRQRPDVYRVGEYMT